MNFEAPADRWSVVADAIKNRRDELGITQTEALVRAGGKVGGSTWSLLERGTKTSYERSKLRAVARALGWSHDSIEKIVAGQEPLELTELGQESELLARLWRLEETVQNLILRFQRLEEARLRMQADRRDDPPPN